MLFRCLLSSIVSDEKSAIILVMIPLCIMCLSVFWRLSRFSLYLWFQQCDYDMPRCGFLCIYHVLGSLRFLVPWVDVSKQLENILAIVFSKIVLLILSTLFTRHQLHV